jgi:hypothetical protein
MASGLLFFRTKRERQVSKFATFLGHCTLLSILVACGGGGDSSGGKPTGGRVYTTNFPLTENPISESGNWINGKTTGLDWADFSSTPGLAIGTQSGTNPALYDDSIALVTGTWRADQMVHAVVKTVNQQTNLIFEELEIWLRSTITPHNSTGYECTFSARSDASAYMGLARWNGTLGDWTSIGPSVTGTGAALHNGDTITCKIVGTVITAYINGVQKWQYDTVNDNPKFSSGQPGIGAFLANTTGVNGDYGFTSVTASD